MGRIFQSEPTDATGGMTGMIVGLMTMIGMWIIRSNIPHREGLANSSDSWASQTYWIWVSGQGLGI